MSAIRKTMPVALAATLILGFTGAVNVTEDLQPQRIQGRTLGSHEPAPIIDHADVRRMLMTMKAYTEAMRCLLYDAVAAEDRMHRAARFSAQAEAV